MDDVSTAGTRSAELNARLASLPSDVMTAAATASCDVDGLVDLSHRYPPTGVEWGQVSRTDLIYTWTISDQAYGNGQYTVEASQVFNVGTGDE